jgi:hypothetical protein
MEACTDTCRKDKYKITVFGVDDYGWDGRILDPVCRDPADPHRVSDQLLRLHFRQSVLANMRGAGEPVFEHDFPPGTDMLPWSVFSHVILPSTLAAKNNALFS